MSDIPILGETKVEQNETEASFVYDIPVPELDENGDVAAPEVPEEPEPNVLTVFTVVVDLDGSAAATNDLDLDGIVPTRTATLQDIRRAVMEVQADIAAIQVSQQTVAMMTQQAQALAQQSQQQQMAAALAKKGIRVKGQ